MRIARSTSAPQLSSLRTLAIVLFAVVAAPEARAERGGCEVVFVRAPDDARLVIEGWLRAEPRCSGTIELRVVETESGTLYLIAQRPDGRIHEREVPDAQSAGVLVASWVADDWTSAPEPDDSEDPAPVVAPLAVDVGSPSTDPMPTVRRARPTGRWFSTAGMVAMEGQGGFGARFEMDLAGGRTSKWTLGAAIAGVSSMSPVMSDGFGRLESFDLRGLVVVARTWRLGENWNVRWSLGVGPMYTEGTAHIDWPETTTNPAHGIDVAYEMGLSLARELLDHRWAIAAGPQFTAITQELDGVMNDIERNKLEVVFLLGARYRL